MINNYFDFLEVKIFIIEFDVLLYNRFNISELLVLIKDSLYLIFFF